MHRPTYFFAALVCLVAALSCIAMDIPNFSVHEELDAFSTFHPSEPLWKVTPFKDVGISKLLGQYDSIELPFESLVSDLKAKVGKDGYIYLNYDDLMEKYDVKEDEFKPLKRERLSFIGIHHQIDRVHTILKRHGLFFANSSKVIKLLLLNFETKNGIIDPKHSHVALLLGPTQAFSVAHAGYIRLKFWKWGETLQDTLVSENSRELTPDAMRNLFDSCKYVVYNVLTDISWDELQNKFHVKDKMEKIWRDRYPAEVTLDNLMGFRSEDEKGKLNLGDRRSESEPPPEMAAPSGSRGSEFSWRESLSGSGSSSGSSSFNDRPE